MGLGAFLRRDRERRRSRRGAAHALYVSLVEQARQPAFYLQGGVPDTLDGRFDMIVLHAFLVLHRLRRAGAEGASLSQALYDLMFADMDRNLREMGAGDLGVGRHVKRMVQAFHGRVAAYEQGLAGAPGALEAALERNLYGTTSLVPGAVAALAAYVRRERESLARQSDAALLAGRVAFGAPPGVAPGRGRGVQGR